MPSQGQAAGSTRWSRRATAASISSADPALRQCAERSDPRPTPLEVRGAICHLAVGPPSPALSRPGPGRVARPARRTSSSDRGRPQCAGSCQEARSRPCLSAGRLRSMIASTIRMHVGQAPARAACKQLRWAPSRTATSRSSGDLWCRTGRIVPVCSCGLLAMAFTPLLCFYPTLCHFVYPNGAIGRDCDARFPELQSVFAGPKVDGGQSREAL
jgi:hypothetical protein